MSESLNKIFPSFLTVLSFCIVGFTILLFVDTEETAAVPVSGSTSSPDRVLVSITEADEVVEDPSESDLKDEKNSANMRRADEAYEVDSREGLTEEELEILSMTAFSL